MREPRNQRLQIPPGVQLSFLELSKLLTKSSQTTAGAITVHLFAFYMHDIASSARAKTAHSWWTGGLLFPPMGTY